MNMQPAKSFLISALASERKLTLQSIALLVLSVALLPVASSAATFNIANGDVAGLIKAINTANSNGQPNTINLASGGTYTLTVANNTSAWMGPSGLPIITSQFTITINGNGATIQRSSAYGTPDFRILAVSNLTSGQLNLDRVTIKGGKGAGGGGIRIDGGNVALLNSTITDNYGSDGGGIFNRNGAAGESHLTLVNCTISRNTGFGGYGGGGILNFVSKTTIINSTIFENRADGPPGFQGRGDAIADGFSAAGSLIVKNSIFASPIQGLGNDLYGTAGALNSQGHNIFGDASGVVTGSGDVKNTNPLLGPFANNGGPTWTHAPLLGSPAINAVPLANLTDAAGHAITTDQRGVARPQGAIGDVGSVELESSCVPPPSGMVGWWPGEGNAKDIQGPTFENGALKNGAMFGPGKVGQAFSLDGIDDFVLVGNPANLNFGTGDFTIDAWIQTSFIGSPPPYRKLIVSKMSSGPDVQYALGYQAGTDGKLVFVIQSSPGVFAEVISPSSIADGKFHHIACVRTGLKVQLYVDGSPVASASMPSLISATSANNVVIGGREDNSNSPYFQGTIDEVEIFNRALSPTEIAAIFNAGSAGKCKQP